MATITGTNNDDILEGGADNDLIRGFGGNDQIFGAGGDDIIEGGDGNDFLDGGDGNDTLLGEDGNDELVVGVGLDVAAGGDGDFDTLTADFRSSGAAINSFNQGGSPDLITIDPAGGFSGTLDNGVDARARFSGIERFIILASAFNDRIVTGDGDDVISGGRGADVLRAGGGSDFLLGEEGNDDISGEAGSDYLDGGEGADVMRGGSGNDFYIVDDAADVVVEQSQEGLDTVSTSLSNYVLSANVEELIGTGSSGQTLRGNVLANRIDGSTGDDFIDARDGGDDAVAGFSGNDGFYFGGTMTAADRVDGGEGARDQIGLQGNYTGLTLNAGNLLGIESVVLLPGSDTRFGDTSGASYDYNISVTAGALVAGQNLNINMSTLRVGEDVVFNGAAETTGTFLFFGGFGKETLTGGQGGDGFFFGTGKFGLTDRVDGSGGSGDQLGLQGDFAGANAVRLGADQIAGIESIVLLSASDTRFGGASARGFNYDITTSDGNVDNGRLTISANLLRADETLVFNGSAEDDSFFRVFSGAGSDSIVGGGLDDQIFGGAGDDRITGGGGADQITGGAGSDLFVYNSTAESSASARDTLNAFTAGDRIDLSGIDARTGGTTNDAFSFVGASAFSGTSGELRVTATQGSGFLVEGDTDGDRIADIVIQVSTADGYALSASDFNF